ncbi:MAG: hypothetical protein LRY73_12670 [Bacillus sp. (in: Bacteria)]|nr:hypothetical protein [Bacillus sp. (in: firmicutes)]
MEADMTMEEVLMEIQRLKAEVGVLSKKKLKKTHPRLVRNALYHFPDWQHAVDESIS